MKLARRAGSPLIPPALSAEKPPLSFFAVNDTISMPERLMEAAILMLGLALALLLS